MALDRQEGLALAPTRRGAVEHRQVLGIEPGRALERHRSGRIYVGGLDLARAESYRGEEVEIGLVDPLRREAESAGEEVLAERPAIEHELDVEGRGDRLFDRRDLFGGKPFGGERLVVDAGCA